MFANNVVTTKPSSAITAGQLPRAVHMIGVHIKLTNQGHYISYKWKWKFNRKKSCAHFAKDISSDLARELVSAKMQHFNRADIVYL